MRNLMRKYWYCTVLALLCCAPTAFGRTAMTLQQSVTSNSSLAGIYTGAYPFSINGSATTITAVCDDFSDEITVGESWKANVYPFSGLNANTPTVLFGKNGSTRQLQDDDEAARLVEQMYKPANAATAGPFSHFWIFKGQYNYHHRPITGTQHDGDDPQVVTAPESPTPVLLGADLSGLATLIFLFRRRTLRRQS